MDRPARRRGRPATTTRPEADVLADEKDRAKLEELKELRLNNDGFTTADF
ncbi:hypothetical protein AB0N06_34465 [Streptomyces sp. NPDC051020]